MTKQDTDMIKKFSLWIPFSRYRRDLRDKVFRLIDREKKASGLHTLQRYVELTTPTKDKTLLKKILKDNLYQISVEVSSFCNRKCWFCPNSFIDRKSQNIELDEEVYKKILSNLAEIDYSGRFCLIRYNEPLANKELILKRIKQARDVMPKANIEINTNGDYIDREYVEALRDAGLNIIYMSYYFDKNKSFDKEQTIKPAIDKMSKKLNLAYIPYEDNERIYRVKFIYEGMDILYGSWNPGENAVDRGGSIKNSNIRHIKRNYPCFAPFGNIDIGYDGIVMACCNVRSEIDSHKDFIMGDMKDTNLFELFMNEKFIHMRKVLINPTPTYNPCLHCLHNNEYMWRPYSA